MVFKDSLNLNFLVQPKQSKQNALSAPLRVETITGTHLRRGDSIKVLSNEIQGVHKVCVHFKKNYRFIFICDKNNL